MIEMTNSEIKKIEDRCHESERRLHEEIAKAGGDQFRNKEKESKPGKSSSKKKH